MNPFLAIDIGNSNVKVARFENGVWDEVASYPSSIDAPPEAWIPRLTRLASGVSASGLCSVVPALEARIVPALTQVTGRAPSVVRARGALPFAMGYETPDTLGNDRVAAAAAAWIQFGRPSKRPVLSFDAGTAITVDAINLTPEGPVYLGGSILPGPHTLRRSLARGTAQLPEVEWERPERAIGRSTSEAIQSGLTALVLDGMDGLLLRSAAELSSPPLIIASGGWGGWIAKRLERVDHVAPTLVLDGIRLLASGEMGFPEEL